jgi:hypothetical protein
MSKKESLEKYLVVEQKGWRIVILGLAIAALFSLTFKAIFSPRRIQYEIDRALSASDPRIKSKLDGAYLSLSDGVWPRLAIVIQKLNVESSDPCLFETKATIENLVLPVALSTLWDRTLIFKQIEVGSLVLQMKARREGCGLGQGLPVIPPLPQTIGQETRPVDNGLLPDDDHSKPLRRDALERPPLVQTMSVESSFLRHIVFNEIRLHFVEWPLFQWELRDVDVKLPLKGQTKTHIEGLVTLTSDPSRFPFQGIHAHLEMDSDNENASANIRGAWREGRVDVQGQWSPNRKDFHWKGSFKQIPWSQLVVLAHALGKAGPLPASSQAWVSAQINWDHESSSPERVIVDDGQIEGEFGDFILGKVIADRISDSPAWKVQPYKVLAKEVDLDILTKMLGWNEPPSAFERLGMFDGEALFTENQLVSMNGVWTALQLIFSNRGRREIQDINHINLDLSGASNRWRGDLSNIELEEGSWNGTIGINLDQNAKSVELESQFSHLRLNQRVEQLMTVKGSLAPMEGKILLKFVDGSAAQANGFLKLDRGTINEVTVEKARVDFEGQADSLTGKIQIQSMISPRTQLDYLPELFSENLLSVQFKNITGKFSRTPKTLDVTELLGTAQEIKARLAIEAGWGLDDLLYGQLQIRSEHQNQTFMLSGSRQSPRWSARAK